MRRTSVYRVFLTRNSEYHLRGCTCIGVRNRRSGQWLADHPAIGMALVGTYTDGEGRMQPTMLPRIGEPLQLIADYQPIQTSAVLAIETRESTWVEDDDVTTIRQPRVSPHDL